MNMRLDVVVNDIVGLTGTKIITAFIAGETTGKNLAKYRHYNCRKPEEEIAKALQYNGRADYLFALKQEWGTYLHVQKQIDEVDVQIKKLLEDIIDQDDNKKQHVANKKSYKQKNKNTIRGADMNQISYQYFEGIDLMEIEGVNLRLTDSALSAIASEATKRKSGARGLRAIMESCMMDIMYEIPSMENVKECVIGEDTVLNKEDPILLFEQPKKQAQDR